MAGCPARVGVPALLGGLIALAAVAPARGEPPAAPSTARAQTAVAIAATEAAMSWGRLAAALREDERPAVALADEVAAWLDTWGGATVEVEGAVWPVDAPEVAAARTALRLLAARTAAPERWVRASLMPFDADGSGLLDRPRELGAVPCAVWRAADHRLWDAGRVGLVRAGGLDGASPPRAASLGVSDGLRDDAFATVAACGVGPDPAMRGVAAAVASLPGGGTSSWDAAVASLLLDAYDLDGSGFLDGPAELEPVPCGVWQAIDRGVRQRWPAGLRVVYGFADAELAYNGMVLAVDAGQRSAVDVRLQACGLGTAVDAAPQGAPDARRGGLRGDGSPLPAPPAPRPATSPPGPAGSPRDATVATAVRALTEAPASAGWDRAVRALLLDAYDADGSGALDAAEVARVSCVVWEAIDDGVRAAYDNGLWQVYGVFPDGAYLGHLVGIDKAGRAALDLNLRVCGRVGSGDTDGTGGPDALSLAPAADGSPPAAGGADDGPRDLSGHDDDASGRVEADELGDVPCATWRALEATTAPLAIGLDPWARSAARAAAARCGVRGFLPLPDLAEGDAGAALIRWLPAGGSAAWDRDVRRALLARFDQDASARLEAGEVDAVPCAVWRALGDAVRGRYPEGLADAYGFAPGSSWEGHVIGIAAAAREASAARLAACGVAASDLPDLADLEGRLAWLERRVVAEWEGVVRPALVLRFDRDASGALETAAEVRGVPCELWRRLDALSRQHRSAGLWRALAVGGPASWGGATLGISGAAAPVVGDALTLCGLAEVAAGPSAAASDAAAALPPADPIAALRAASPALGVAAWEEEVRAILRWGFGEGEGLDGPAAARAVPCAAWELLDAGARMARGAGVVSAYLGTDADALRLGVTPAARKAAVRRARACVR